MHVQPETSPSSGPAHAPLLPQDSAPSRPVTSGLCVVEAVLAATVFVFTALDFASSTSMFVASFAGDYGHGGVVREAFSFASFAGYLFTQGPFGIVLFATGCAVRNGVARSLGLSNARETARIPGDIDRLERDRLAKSLERDGVDLFDFHEIIETSVSILGGILVWALFQAASAAVVLACRLFVVMCGVRKAEPTTHMAVWLALYVALKLLIFAYSFYRFRFGERFRKLDKSCRTQPSCKLAQAALKLSSIAYAIVLHFSRAPSVWRWSLVVTHTARVLTLLVSLRRRLEGMGAAADVPRDTLKGCV